MTRLVMKSLSMARFPNQGASKQRRLQQVPAPVRWPVLPTPSRSHRHHEWPLDHTAHTWPCGTSSFLSLSIMGMGCIPSFFISSPWGGTGRKPGSLSFRHCCKCRHECGAPFMHSFSSEWMIILANDPHRCQNNKNVLSCCRFLSSCSSPVLNFQKPSHLFRFIL